MHASNRIKRKRIKEQKESERKKIVKVKVMIILQRAEQKTVCRAEVINGG